MKKSIRTLTFPRLMTAAIVLACTSFTSQGALLLQYKFNEGTGTTVADTGDTTPAANATLSTGIGASWVADSPGAYDYSGSTVGMTTSGTSNLAINSTPAQLTKLAGLTKVTLTGWVNLNATPADLDRLISFTQIGGSSGIDLWFSGTGSSQLTLSFSGVTVASNNGTNPFAVGDWVFFAVTAEMNKPTNSVNFYTGTESGSVALLGDSRNQNLTIAPHTIQALEIAGSVWSGSDRTPLGYFSDFRVYDEALSLTALENVRSSAVIPEPSAVVLLAAGFGALVLLRRRR